MSKIGLKELRFLFCVDGQASQGMRTFIKRNYTHLKLQNSDLPLVVRYGKGTEARVCARYPGLKEEIISVENMSEEDIKKTVAKFLK